MAQISPSGLGGADARRAARRPPELNVFFGLIAIALIFEAAGLDLPGPELPRSTSSASRS